MGILCHNWEFLWAGGSRFYLLYRKVVHNIRAHIYTAPDEGLPRMVEHASGENSNEIMLYNYSIFLLFRE